MGDLISRKALLKHQFEVDEENPKTGYYDLPVVSVYDIENATPVDAVAVIRCKDCKRWMKDVAGCTDFVGRCAYANYMIGATGYCLYGERKEN